MGTVKSIEQNTFKVSRPKNNFVKSKSVTKVGGKFHVKKAWGNF